MYGHEQIYKLELLKIANNLVMKTDRPTLISFFTFIQ